jgi:hypothetical protein
MELGGLAFFFMFELIPCREAVASNAAQTVGHRQPKKSTQPLSTDKTNTAKRHSQFLVAQQFIHHA